MIGSPVFKRVKGSYIIAAAGQRAAVFAILKV
jgi:hypothetical protein